jgi:Cd2+/Zn2+-exporting ATPase
MKTKLDLSVLLPEVPDTRDACVGRLQQVLTSIPGVYRVHILECGTSTTEATVCLHYDPSTISIADVQKKARSLGGIVTQQFGHVLLKLHAVGSEDLSQRIEKEIIAIPGVVAASVNFAGQSALVEFDCDKTTSEDIIQLVRDLGYLEKRAKADETINKEETSRKISEHAVEGFFARNTELNWSLVAGTLLAVALVTEAYFDLPRMPVIAIYLASYAFGGFDLVRHSLRSLRKGRFVFNIDLLMLLAAIGAAVLDEFAEGAFLLFLFSFAHALEHYALGRARNAIKALADLAPPKARIQRGEREIEVDVAEVKVGEVAVVRPGERIPVDGTITRGRSAVNQAPVTGESIPVEKEVGAEVFAGTVNGDGALEIETTKAAGDRTLDRVVKLVEEAQTQKAPTQQFTDRFERVFVPMVLCANVLLICVPPVLGWWPLSVSFYRGMTMLVAASPCALALGTPATVLAAIAQAARNGILIKGGAHLENLGMIRAIAFDKTGTLTTGKPEVTDIVTLEGVDEMTLLRVTAAVERRSQHPLAQAVVRRAEAEGISLPPSGELQSITGRGVRSSVHGKQVEIGSLKLWDKDVDLPQTFRESVDKLQSAGKSIVAVKFGEQFLGTLALADEPRPGVEQILKQLRNSGIEKVVMLTGDNAGVGNAIGKRLGADEVQADLMPEAKVDAIRELLRRFKLVAMVGDGVNDAPALANATVGIAMGGSGAGVALETADVALMADDLGKLPFAVQLSRRARRVIRQNLFLSLGVIAFLMLAAITGAFGIGLTVVMHEGSTLVVIANALRLLSTAHE